MISRGQIYFVRTRSLDPARFFDPKTHRPNLAGSAPSARMAEVETALRLVLNLG
jgi:hypothetical protein